MWRIIILSFVVLLGGCDGGDAGPGESLGGTDTVPELPGADDVRQGEG